MTTWQFGSTAGNPLQPLGPWDWDRWLAGSATPAGPVLDHSFVAQTLTRVYHLAILDAHRRGAQLQRSILTRGALSVPGFPSEVPENATLAGFSKVVPREYPYLRTKLVDYALPVSAEALMRELLAEEAGVFCLREGTKYAETFAELLLLENPGLLSAEPYVKAFGNYLVTGGAGALGLEVCGHLARQNTFINLFLVGRSPVPDRTVWDEVVQNSHDPALVDRIRGFQAIESTGATLHFYSGDVADRFRMTEIFGEVRRDWGRIDGIVHAAGIPGKNLIQFRTLADFGAVVQPKVQGTFLLDWLTRDDRPDFLVYFSSVATVFPSAGQADYAAGNFYLDTTLKTLPTSVGRAIFDAALRSGVDKIDVTLTGRESGAWTPTEQAVARCWAKAFGYQELGMDDEFTALGGDSIAGLTIAAYLSTYFGVNFEAPDPLAAKTIGRCAQRIDAMIGALADPEGARS